MKTYTTLIFDLDGTLAITKSPLSDSMSEVFSKALQVLNLAIITGGTFNQIKKQVIDRLDTNVRLEHLYILPTSGSEMLTYNTNTKSWDVIYSKQLSVNQKTKIIESLHTSLDKSSFTINNSLLLGEQIEDRGSQITFSALGQDQAAELKRLWDPKELKRREMMFFMEEIGDDFDIKLGGSTSIDITLKGIDKEYGINNFLSHTGFDIKKTLFIGDKIIPGGNDWAATKTGIDTRSTSGPEETQKIILEKI
jgi:hypothetical protein